MVVCQDDLLRLDDVDVPLSQVCLDLRIRGNRMFCVWLVAFASAAAPGGQRLLQPSMACQPCGRLRNTPVKVNLR